MASENLRIIIEAVDKFTATTKKVTGDLQKVETNTKKTAKATQNLNEQFSAFGNVVKGIAIAAVTQQFAQLVESVQRVTNRVKVVTKDFEDLRGNFQAVAKVAVETRSDLEATAVLYARISFAANKLGVTQTQALLATQSLGKMLVVQGATMHESRSAMLQLSQALQSGKLAGDEFRSISEILPALLDMLAEATGRTKEELKDLASQGRLTPTVILKALLDNQAKIDALFQKTNVTFEQGFNRLRTNLSTIIFDFINFGPVISGIGPLFLSLENTLKGVFGTVTAGITIVASLNTGIEHLSRTVTGGATSINLFDIALIAVNKRIGIAVAGIRVLVDLLNFISGNAVSEFFNEKVLKDNAERSLLLGSKTFRDLSKERDRLNEALGNDLKLGSVEAKQAFEDLAKVNKQLQELRDPKIRELAVRQQVLDVAINIDDELKSATSSVEQFTLTAESLFEAVKRDTGSLFEGVTLEEFSETYKTQIEKIVSDSEYNLDAASGAFRKYRDQTNDTFAKVLEDYQDIIYKGVILDLPNAFGDAVAQTIVDGENFKDAITNTFKQVAKQVIAQLVAMIAQMLLFKVIMQSLGLGAFFGMPGSMMGVSSALGPLSNLLGGEGGGLLSVLDAPSKAIGGLAKGARKITKKFGFADGGRPPVGVASIVGEEGPELFVPDTPGTIVPNGGMGGTVVIQKLEIMPGANVDQALVDKPMTFWVDLAQEKILPALNTLGQAGNTTTLNFRGNR